MNRHYKDILSRIATSPKWFDEAAVPRFCDFAPDECSNIYADECALVLIQCQACATEFEVCFSESTMTRLKLNMMARRDGLGPSLLDQITKGAIHYGDPPNIECCPAGPTMNSEPKQVLQYWTRTGHEWTRDSSAEVRFKSEWVEDAEKTP
jgi:hypothetical protein